MINYYKIFSINQQPRRSAVPMLKFIIVRRWGRERDSQRLGRCEGLNKLRSLTYV